MSFKKELEVMLHQMTCRVPHPTNYDFFCEYRDVEIPKTADSIINLVDKELPEKKYRIEGSGGTDNIQTKTWKVPADSGYNQAIEDMRNKLRGE